MSLPSLNKVITYLLFRNSCIYRIELDSHNVSESKITRKEMQDAVDDAGLNGQEKIY